MERTNTRKERKATLAEGIDCNEDGEYAERSAAIYNCVNNNAMIDLGTCTGKEEYFDHAVRNLRMMLTYMEPDGTVFTANSTRQDNGKRSYPSGLLLALSVPRQEGGRFRNSWRSRTGSMS